MYFVVVFTMLLREDVEKQEAEEAKRKSNAAAGKNKSETEESEGFQPSADDLD